MRGRPVRGRCREVRELLKTGRWMRDGPTQDQGPQMRERLMTGRPLRGGPVRERGRRKGRRRPRRRGGPGTPRRPATTCTARRRWPGRSAHHRGRTASPPGRGPGTGRRPHRTTGHLRPHRPRRLLRRRGGRRGDGDPRGAASQARGMCRMCRMCRGSRPAPPRTSRGPLVRSASPARRPEFRVRQTDHRGAGHCVPDTVGTP